MAMSALAIRPLINKLRYAEPDARQIWFADDATAAGKLATLRWWWQLITTTGSDFAYCQNARKAHLVVISELVDEAKGLFDNTNVQISTNGRETSGCCHIGTQEFVEAYAVQKIEKWVNEIESLTEIAHTHPHEAYTAFVNGVIGRWLYRMRTSDIINSSIFQPLRDVIHHKIIPALTRQAASSAEVRKSLSLSLHSPWWPQHCEPCWNSRKAVECFKSNDCSIEEDDHWTIWGVHYAPATISQIFPLPRK